MADQASAHLALAQGTMTENVIALPQRSEPNIWTCLLCSKDGQPDNECFWLYEDGRIQCTRCKGFHSEATGRWKPGPPAPVATLEKQ